jgi:hypothetical protein
MTGSFPGFVSGLNSVGRQSVVGLFHRSNLFVVLALTLNSLLTVHFQHLFCIAPRGGSKSLLNSWGSQVSAPITYPSSKSFLTHRFSSPEHRTQFWIYRSRRILSIGSNALQRVVNQYDISPQFPQMASFYDLALENNV